MPGQPGQVCTWPRVSHAGALSARLGHSLRGVKSSTPFLSVASGRGRAQDQHAGLFLVGPALTGAGRGRAHGPGWAAPVKPTQVFLLMTDFRGLGEAAPSTTICGLSSPTLSASCVLQRLSSTVLFPSCLGPLVNSLLILQNPDGAHSVPLSLSRVL